VPDERQRQWVEDMAEAYDRWLVPTVFHPFAVDMAARVAACRPRRVLELAAGSGALTCELLAAVDAEVVATDLNEAMVAVGAGRAPTATWRAADALDLPFADGGFDVVVCQFGAMFFPDRVAGFREAGRVLGEGGTLLVSTWGALERHGFEAALTEVTDALFPDDPPHFLRDVPHSCDDPGPILDQLRAAGFDDVTAETVVVTSTGSAADLARGYARGTPLRRELSDRGDLDEAERAIDAGLAAALGAGAVTAEMEAHVFTARRPAAGTSGRAAPAP
jgi:SAM-dependent methyltransferase